MTTKDIAITWENIPAKVTMRRLTFGEMNALNDEVAQIRMQGETPQVNILQSRMKESGILKSIVSAPFTVTIDNIRRLDNDDGNKLFEIFMELNNVGASKKAS